MSSEIFVGSSNLKLLAATEEHIFSQLLCVRPNEELRKTILFDETQQIMITKKCSTPFRFRILLGLIRYSEVALFLTVYLHMKFQ